MFRTSFNRVSLRASPGVGRRQSPLLRKNHCFSAQNSSLDSKKLEEDPPKRKLGFLTETMRGMGQMAFCADARSGALVLTALTFADPTTGMCALLGCTASTAAAKLYKSYNPAFAEMGLHGFNGGLFGAAATVLLPPLGSSVLAAVAALGGAATSLLVGPLTRLMGSLPYVSIPFNAAFISFLAVHNSVQLLPIRKETTSVGLQVKEAVNSLAATADAAIPGQLVEALNGCGQMAFAGRPASGVAMLAAVALSYGIRSPRMALEAVAATLGGSVVGAMGSSWAGVPPDLIALGLTGFNPALTCLAIYTFIGPSNSKAPSSLMLGALLACGAVTATALNGILSESFSAFGLPACALPFCIAAPSLIWLAPKLYGLKRRF